MRLQAGLEQYIKGSLEKYAPIQFGGDGDDKAWTCTTIGDEVVVLIISNSSSLFGINKPNPGSLNYSIFLAVFSKLLKFKRGAWIYAGSGATYNSTTIDNYNTSCSMAFNSSTRNLYVLHRKETGTTWPTPATLSKYHTMTRVNFDTLTYSSSEVLSSDPLAGSFTQFHNQLCFTGSHIINAMVPSTEALLTYAVDIPYTYWLGISGITTGVQQLYGFEKVGTTAARLFANTVSPDNNLKVITVQGDASSFAAVTFNSVTYPITQGGFTDESDSDRVHFFGYADSGKTIKMYSAKLSTHNTKDRETTLVTNLAGNNWNTYGIRISRLTGGYFILSGKCEYDFGAALGGVPNGVVLLCRYQSSAPYYSVVKAVEVGQSGKSTLVNHQSFADGFVSKETDLDKSELWCCGFTNGDIYGTHGKSSSLRSCLVFKTNLL